MPTTPNKGYEVQTTGTNTDTWGSVLNDDMISVVDENLGGITTKTLASSNVVLTADESKTLVVRLNGTLSANVLVTTAAIGMTIVENVTSGAFAVTFGNGVGTPVTIPQGTRAVVITDTTNGPRTAADSVTEFASGTRLVFNQTAAPTGWTKESSATYNAAALQFTTGSVGTGGSLAFGTAFASRTITGTVGNTTLTVNQIPSHGHPARYRNVAGGSEGTALGGFLLHSTSDSNFAAFSGTPSETLGQQIGGTGGDQSHNHSLTVNNLDISVKYASCIIAQKD